MSKGEPLTCGEKIAEGLGDEHPLYCQRVPGHPEAWHSAYEPMHAELVRLRAQEASMREALSMAHPLLLNLTDMLEAAVRDGHVKADTIRCIQQWEWPQSCHRAIAAARVALARPRETREEFIAGYVGRSNMTMEQFLETGLTVDPCDCGVLGCRGWAMK